MIGDRRQLHHFVGVSLWDHGPLLGRLQQEVGEEIGDPQGALVVDGAAMPKKGTESVGVARQWCGRLGKVESCQLGVFLAYAGKDSSTLVDERLYPPRAWAFDGERRNDLLTRGRAPNDPGGTKQTGLDGRTDGIGPATRSKTLTRWTMSPP